MDTPKHSDFRGECCGAQARRRVSVFKGSFLCLEKNCWPRPTGLLSLPHRPPQHPCFFEGEKMIFKPSNMLLASFLPAIFSTRTNPASNESLFSVRVFLPLKKRESFHIKKCTATFLCYLLGLLWQATDTKPQEIQVQQRSGICYHCAQCGKCGTLQYTTDVLYINLQYHKWHH